MNETTLCSDLGVTTYTKSVSLKCVRFAQFIKCLMRITNYLLLYLFVRLRTYVLVNFRSDARFHFGSFSPNDCPVDEILEVVEDSKIPYTLHELRQSK